MKHTFYICDSRVRRPAMPRWAARVMCMVSVAVVVTGIAAVIGALGLNQGSVFVGAGVALLLAVAAVVAREAGR